MRILVTGGSGFIGTNLVEQLVKAGYEILNLDTAKPHMQSHASYWRNVSILDSDAVQREFNAFQPDAVIHLAARTDTDPANTIDDYQLNTKGSSVVIDAVKKSTSVKRSVFTSTQFVHQYKGAPQHDQDFAPHTVYGESKVIMEKMIRDANLACTWTVIRPTNIWGPWHLRYPYEFWNVLSKGLYIHPGREPVMRSYGYVGNVAHQIVSILKSDQQKVNGRIFYVGDLPINIYDWVNGFSRLQTGKNVLVVPRVLVQGLGLVGDVLAKLKLKFPITSSRFKSMTTSNDAPMEATIKAFGLPPISLDEGIAETVEWMKKYHPNLVTRKD